MTSDKLTGRNAYGGQPPGDAADEAAGDATADLGRRRFFHRVAGELLGTAASLTGVAMAAQGAAMGAAAAIDGLAEGTRPSSRESVAHPAAAAVAAMEDGRPWAPDGNGLRVLDQRRLPETVAGFPVASVGAAVRAIRERVVSGPAVAQLAGLALAMGADAVADRDPGVRGTLWRGATHSLIDAAPWDAALQVAVRRLSSVAEGATAALVRAEAEAIVAEAATAHEAIAAAALGLLRAQGWTRPLLLGASGALWGGGVGTAQEAAARAAGQVPGLRVTIAEGRPWLDGARVAAWELDRASVDHLLVTDNAAGTLLADREVDVVLLAGDRLLDAGSVEAPVGGFGLAVIAAWCSVPVVVCVRRVDSEPRTGETGPRREGSPEDVLRFGRGRIAPTGTVARAIASDVVPQGLVTWLVTDAGVEAPGSDA